MALLIEYKAAPESVVNSALFTLPHTGIIQSQDL